MIVSKTRNAPGWATKEDNLIPNGVKCNENVIWVSVLRLGPHNNHIWLSRNVFNFCCDILKMNCHAD